MFIVPHHLHLGQMNKLAAVALLIAALSAPLPASGLDIKGRISASYMNQDDTVSTHDYNVYSTNLKLDVTDFAGENAFFHFKGRVRKAGSNDFNSQTPDYRVRDANLELKELFNKTDLVLGRQYVSALPGARLDGALLRFHRGEHYLYGLFGGMKPDPYEEHFNSDYSIAGAYGLYKNKQSRVTLGYATTWYKGKEDSSYLYGSGNYGFNRKMYIYLSARGDHNIDNGSYELTNLLGTFSYRIGRRSRVRVTYNQYRGIQLYESMDYNINRDLQTAWRLYVDYGVRKTTSVYARYDVRTRSSDNKTAYLYMVGVRENRFLKRFFTDVSYRSINYFTSKITQYYVSVGMDAGRSVTVRTDYTKSENRQADAPNKLDQEIYGISLDWYGKSKIFVTGRYEETQEKYLPIESIFTAQENDFKSRTIYLSAGYRF